MLFRNMADSPFLRSFFNLFWLCLEKYGMIKKKQGKRNLALEEKKEKTIFEDI